MSKLNQAASELREMDDLALLRSPVHDLHPLAKLLTTVAYILITVSFGKYDLSGLAVMVLFPILLFTVSGIPVRTCFHKLRIVLPLVCAVGLFNPFLDHTPLMHVGGITVTGGVISMITLMLKGVFSLMASFVLVATTRMDAICAALRRIHVPGLIVSLLLLTYRYISVMIDEVAIMTDAYALRAPGQKGVHYRAWGSFLGQLLLRSMDKAGELYSSMQLRGFAGEFRYAEGAPARVTDYVYTGAVIAMLIVCRRVDIAGLLGGMMM